MNSSKYLRGGGGHQLPKIKALMLFVVNADTVFKMSEVNRLFKMAVFWVVVPCGLVEINRRFITLRMEETSTSETSVNF
jgi:hypothetical protein